MSLIYRSPSVTTTTIFIDRRGKGSVDCCSRIKGCTLRGPIECHLQNDHIAKIMVKERKRVPSFVVPCRSIISQLHPLFSASSHHLRPVIPPTFPSMFFFKSLLLALAALAVLATTASASGFAKVKRADERILVKHSSNKNFCSKWNKTW
jgi:hypothetical protein